MFDDRFDDLKNAVDKEQKRQQQRISEYLHLVEALERKLAVSKAQVAEDCMAIINGFKQL